MENTAKALLIAASVLIVILIVAISLRIFNSSNNTADSVGKVGGALSSTTTDVSKDVIDIIKDTTSKNLIKVKDFTINISNKYYHSYFPKNPKVLLEPNTEYILIFDYKINSADYTIGCGIGYGETYYRKDIIYSATYPNQTEGRFEKTFTTPSSFIESMPYLQIRFARMGKPGNMNVEISNVSFRKTQ